MQNFNFFLFNSLENSILNPLDQFDIRDLISINGFDLYIYFKYIILFNNRYFFLLILNNLSTNL